MKWTLLLLAALLFAASCRPPEEAAVLPPEPPATTPIEPEPIPEEEAVDPEPERLLVGSLEYSRGYSEDELKIMAAERAVQIVEQERPKVTVKTGTREVIRRREVNGRPLRGSGNRFRMWEPVYEEIDARVTCLTQRVLLNEDPQTRLLTAVCYVDVVGEQSDPETGWPLRTVRLKQAKLPGDLFFWVPY